MTIMLSRDKVKESIDKLPEQFSLEELIDRMLLIEKAQIQIQKGEFYTEQEVDKEIEKWFE